MRRLPPFLLILVALWLPVQAAAAQAMPFCRHSAGSQPTEPVAATLVHCHEQGTPADAPAVPAADLGCDDCEMCHLATAGYLPATEEARVPRMVSVYVAQPPTASKSFIADPPDQPPRRHA